MNKPNTAQITADAATSEPDTFEVQERETDDLEVVEFESSPLTDINFGF